MIKTSHILIYIYCFCLSLLLTDCQKPTEKEFINGHYNFTQDLLVLKLDSGYVNHQGWEEKKYYSGKGVNWKQGESADEENFLLFPIYLNEDDLAVKLWILAAKTSKSEFKGAVEISFFDAMDSLFAKPIEIGKFDIKPQLATSWLQLSNDRVNLPKAGSYILKLHYSGEAPWYLEKMLLSKNGDFQPEGTGPALTWEMTNERFDSLNKPEIILPPDWAFGTLYGSYTNQKESMSRVEKLFRDGYPVDAYWIDSWFWDYAGKGDGPGGYLNFIGDTTAFPDVEEMWAFMSEKGVRNGIWLWDTILKDENEEVYKKFKEKGYFAKEYENTIKWHNKHANSITGDINFDSEEAAKYWKEQLKHFFDKGLDFTKLDRTSDISYCRTAFEATAEYGQNTQGRGFILAHLHTTYDDEFKLYPTKWTGDAKITWTQPDYPDMSVYAMGGFKENIQMIADPKKTTYEIPFLAHDAGGYNFFGSEEMSDELYYRWTQFSAFSPVMTLFTTADNPTANLPFNFSQEAADIFKKYANLRNQLFPYIYSFAHQTINYEGRLVSGFSQHPEQFLFGNQFLVAPIYTPQTSNRELWLPEGKWIEYHFGKEHDGGKMVELEGYSLELPLLVKKGAIIPKRPPSQNINSGDNQHLVIEIFPSKTASEFVLTEDDGVSLEYKEGKVGNTKIHQQAKDNVIEVSVNPMEGSFNGMPEERTWEFRIFSDKELSEVVVDGENHDLELLIEHAKGALQCYKFTTSYSVDKKLSLQLKQ